jgi:hypothetical protein
MGSVGQIVIIPAVLDPCSASIFSSLPSSKEISIANLTRRSCYSIYGLCGLDYDYCGAGKCYSGNCDTDIGGKSTTGECRDISIYDDINNIDESISDASGANSDWYDYFLHRLLLNCFR